jgi:hypothetical protein
MSEKLTTAIQKAVIHPKNWSEQKQQSEEAFTKDVVDWILLQEPVANLYRCNVSNQLAHLCKNVGADPKDYLKDQRVRVYLKIVNEETLAYMYPEWAAPYLLKTSEKNYGYTREIELTLEELKSWNIDPCTQFPAFGEFVRETKRYAETANQRRQLWGAINYEIQQVTTANQLVKRYPLVRQFMPQWALEALDRKVERAPRSAEPEINPELNQEMMKAIIGGN